MFILNINATLLLFFNKRNYEKDNANEKTKKISLIYSHTCIFLTIHYKICSRLTLNIMGIYHNYKVYLIPISHLYILDSSSKLVI